MIKKITKIFIPPKNWKLPVIIVLGIFIGLTSYSVYISKVWSYASDKPETCINCHIMTPQYATWNHSSHREVTNCNDCHVPHNNIFNKYYFKAKDGLNHATLYTMRAERQVITIGNAGSNVVKNNCIRCHSYLLDQSKIISQTKGNYQVHNTERNCWECHREVPHSKIRSLSSTPNAKVPLLESPVPKWLNKLINK